MGHTADRLEAQMQALAQIFVEGLTPKEALTALDTGPSELYGLCYRWALASSEQVERETRVEDAVSAEGLFERAPIVRGLAALAFERFTERFGTPQEPRLPERPEGLCVSIQPELNESERARMSRSARFLVSTAIYGAPGMSWQNFHYITKNKDRSQWVLWVNWESEYDRVTTRNGWVDVMPGMTEHDAALFLLEDYWKTLRDIWDEERPSEISGESPLVTYDEIQVVAERVWGPEA